MKKLAVIVRDPSDMRRGKIGLVVEDQRDIGRCLVEFNDKTTGWYETGETKDTRHQLEIIGEGNGVVSNRLRIQGYIELADDYSKIVERAEAREEEKRATLGSRLYN